MSSSSANGAHLRLEGITKSYGSRTVVKSLELSVAPGEFFTILGPSGSGKTTTLMLVAGFSTPSAGEIYIDERPVARVPVHKRNIGVVFQNYGLFPHLTVAENIAFPLQLRGHARQDIQQRVAAMLDMVRLAGFQDRLPQQLSGGQQQRVALARSLAYRPKVLLLDEPLSALDKNLREQMQMELKNLHRTVGATIVCVTHDQAEALALSDRIAILNGGSIEQVDTPQNLYERPCSRFVATFIGESNILPGRFIESSGAHARVATEDGLTFTAVRRDASAVGAPAEVIVRPQHVLLGAPADGLENSFQGLIRHRLYAGDCLKVGIEISPTVSLIAQIPNSLAAAGTFMPGERITVGFAVDAAMAFSAHDTLPDGSPDASL